MWWAEHCGNWWCPQWLHPTPTPAHPYAWRPFMLRIAHSTDVTIDGVTLLNPGFWCIVPTHSDNVRVRNVRIDSGGKGPNTDGIEPMWSSNVLVQNVSVHNGDDCITIKSGSRNVHPFCWLLCSGLSYHFRSAPCQLSVPHTSPHRTPHSAPHCPNTRTSLCRCVCRYLFCRFICLLSVCLSLSLSLSRGCVHAYYPLHRSRAVASLARCWWKICIARGRTG